MNNKSIDAFTSHILNNIDFKVFNSLSPEQLSAIRDAIRAGNPQKKHAIDIRGIINLFFIRYYFVILMGRDRRISREAVEEERRGKMTLLGNVIFLIVVLLGLTLIVMIGLYGVKMISGIDLVPGKHMGGIFGL